MTSVQGTLEKNRARHLLRLPYHLKLLTSQDVHEHRLVGPEVASKCWSVSLWDIAMVTATTNRKFSLAAMKLSVHATLSSQPSFLVIHHVCQKKDCEVFNQRRRNLDDLGDLMSHTFGFPSQTAGHTEIWAGRDRDSALLENPYLVPECRVTR
jgi:hypothetical protein